MGKDGSQWKHGYIPENGAAVALKMHRNAGGSGTSSGTAKRAKSSKPAVDLSTREGRARAVAGADLSTPQGRSLVAKAQRASLYSTKTSHVPGSSVKKMPKAKSPAKSKSKARRSK